MPSSSEGDEGRGCFLHSVLLGPSAGREYAGATVPKVNIAKSLRKPQSERRAAHGTQNGWRWLAPCVELPLVLSVRVHRVDLRRRRCGARSRRSSRRPATRSGWPLEPSEVTWTVWPGREVHHADVEVALVAAGERDPRPVGRPGALVVPVARERHAPGARALGVHDVDLRRPGQVRGVEDLAARRRPGRARPRGRGVVVRRCEVRRRATPIV